MSSTDAFIRECNQWKLLGAMAWHFGLFIFGAIFWHALSPPWSQHFHQLVVFSSWMAKLLVYSSMLVVVYAQRQVLTTIDVPPVFVPQLGWSAKSWPSLFITRCIIRTRKLWDLLYVLAFYASCVASSCLGLYLLQPTNVRLDLQPLMVYGVTLGLMYGVGFLIRGKNVLSFPVIQRHRYFRMKQRMRALVKSSLVLSTVALIPALMLTTLFTNHPWGGVRAVLAAWRAAMLCVFGWSAGAHMLEVVFTERVAMAGDDDPQPTAPLIAAMKHRDPIVQDWCLMDLTAVAEGAAGCTNRRAAVFADETGANGWTPLATYCLIELKDFVQVMASALPSVLGAASAGSGMKWNSLQLTTTGQRSASKQQDLALWHLQARHVRLSWCMRVLSGLTAAAMKQDTYGLLQLSNPDLSSVLGVHLAVVTVLQAFLKHTSSIPSKPPNALGRLIQQLTLSSSGSSSSMAPQQHVDVATCALLDTAKTCTYRISNTYGAVLSSVVGKSKPLVGTVAEAQTLLASFLAHKE